VIPERARAVVIGGGVIGCSILYHLAKQGWTDSLLLEQYQLTHGSTWHSAGLVGQLRSSISLTRMMQYSVGLYAELKELTGNDPGWHQLGGLRLASSEARPDSWLPEPETQRARDRGHFGAVRQDSLACQRVLILEPACLLHGSFIAPSRVILKVWCKRSRCTPMLHVHLPTLGFAASLSDATNSSVTMS
jgi:glycine/D-amino acid oxidase-like deaminating enzyme